MSDQALYFVPPIEINSARLTASNIPEPDTGETAWVVGTTYALGARVIVVADHAVYESLQAGNVGKAPATNPTWWIRVSATNRYRMFDTVNSSASTRTGGIDVTITPSAIVNSIALLNVQTQSIRIRMTDPIDGLVFDETYDMQAPPLFPLWWNYYFDDISVTTDLYVALPSYRSATVRVELIQPSGDASVGTMILGNARPIGEGVEYGASLGIQDYSRKERNTFGDLVLVERSYAKRASFRMQVPHSQRGAVNKLLAEYRAKPSLWIGVQGEEDTYIFGIYKDYQFIIEFVEHSVLTLDLEGLT